MWAERLLGDGVDVVIDIFDLKEGHDKNHFMEKMVTDQTITHVLVMCDKVYAEKANARKAGVGTESQIISSEVYGKVAQSKFIPIACEFSDEREPFVPAFMKSRIFVDFSSPEATNKNWEQLVRVLFHKPLFQKPALGLPPAYLTATGKTASPANGKLESLKTAITSNARHLKHYREDFLSSSWNDADALRVRQNPQLDQNGLAQKVLADCGLLKDVRNRIVDWVLLESSAGQSEDFQESLLQFLEKLLELKGRPEELNGGYRDQWFEAHSVFVYETFLYIVAALLKTNSFSILHEVFKSHYLKPPSQRYGNEKFDDFGAFYGYSELLQILAPERQQLYSPAAELMQRQADRADLPFRAIIEAELVVLLSALIRPDVHWFPQTFFYRANADFPFFIRTTQHRYFLRLAEIIGVSDASALRDAAKLGFERLHLHTYAPLALHSMSVWEAMNLDKLDTL